VLLAAREQAPELLARAKALLAPYHAPKAVAAVGAIPVLPSGKPDRMRARRLAREIFCR